MPLTAKNKENVGFYVQHKSSITHHGEGSSIASPTQMEVGKGIPNKLIAKGLLKNLKGVGPVLPPKIPYQFPLMEW